MTNTVWPVDAVAGAPAYSGKLARQAMGVALFGATSARPLGARSGVRVGTPTNTITVSGSTATIKPHAGVLDLQASAASGPYWYAFDANQTVTLNAPHASFARIDIISVRLDDPAESDGSSVPAVVVVYTAGTAAASPVAPSTATARELVLANITVPASGGGAATVSWAAPYVVGAGATVPVPNTTARNALATAVGPTAQAPLYVSRATAPAGANTEFTLDGTTWYTLDGRDTGWISLTASSGYISSAEYRIIGETVHVRGQMDKSPGNVADGHNLFTLPTAARPSTLARQFVVPGAAGALMKLVVGTSGTVTVSSTPTATTTYARVDFTFAI